MFARDSLVNYLKHTVRGISDIIVVAFGGMVGKWEIVGEECASDVRLELRRNVMLEVMAYVRYWWVACV